MCLCFTGSFYKTSGAKSPATDQFLPERVQRFNVSTSVRRSLSMPLSGSHDDWSDFQSPSKSKLVATSERLPLADVSGQTSTHAEQLLNKEEDLEGCAFTSLLKPSCFLAQF